ncbi:MAG TPA: choline kinase family protein [Gammaproteobacteria bacterium]
MNIEDEVRAGVLRALRDVLADSGFDAIRARHELRLEPLDGGIGRRTYLASAGERAWVVRAGVDGTGGALDLAVESAIMSEAAAIGVAPPVVAADARAGLLVTEYRAGARPLASDDLGRPERVEALAALLRRLHAIRPALRPFDPEGFAAQYLAPLEGAGDLSGRQRRLAADLRALARDYRARYPSVALCHNDLIASNVLDEDGRLWLIDFEYAVTASPVLDIAGLAAMNGRSRAEAWELAEAYYAGRAVPFTPAELDKVVRLVALTGYFWALAAARTVADPAPFERLGERLAGKFD